MPQVTATRSVDRALDEIWPFVEDIDRWAPLMKGYVAHHKTSDRDSLWTLRGDLGPYSREVQLAVAITEWTAPRRIAFTLTGTTEQVRGSGVFELTESLVDVPAPPARSFWQRVLDWLLGRTPPPPPTPDATAHVQFTFEVHAGGPMGPMIDALLGPWSEVVATDLLNSVAKELEPTP